MTKKSKTKRGRVIVIATAILAGVSLIGLFFLPDGKMGSKYVPNASIYWLLLGIIHSGLVVFLLTYFIVRALQDKGLKGCFTINMALVISIVILWLLLVESNVRSGYIRNKTIKIPNSMLPKGSEHIETPKKIDIEDNKGQEP